MKTQSKTSLLLILVVCCSCAVLPVSAQLAFGARAGANLATEPAQGLYHQFLARPYFGIFANYKFKIPVALQVGVNYSGEGANYKDLGTDETFKIRHSFLTIPVLVQYRFGFGGYIEAGPQFGLLLSAREKYNDEASTDAKQYYKGTDVSAGIGLGYDLGKGGLQGLGFNVRYMRGLTKLNKTDVGDNSDIKSRVLSIGVTYTIRGHKNTNKK